MNKCMMLKFFATAMFAMIPLMNLHANESQNFVWGSHDGTSLGSTEGFIQDANTKRTGSVLVDSDTATLHLQDGDTLLLDGMITVGSSTIDHFIIDASALSENGSAIINVGGSLIQDENSDSAQRGYVLIAPYNQPQNENTQPTHLGFNVPEDRSIEIRCQTVPLVHTGAWTKPDSNFPNSVENRDFIVSYWGAGQVNYRMKDGCNVIFKNSVDPEISTQANDYNFAGIEKYECGFVPLKHHTDSTDADFNKSNGVKVYCMMDQNETQAVERAECKVMFSRYEFGSGNGNPAEVWIGRYSYFTYLSDNITGHFDDAHATVGGYANVGFDPSASTSREQSRLALRLLGGTGTATITTNDDGDAVAQKIDRSDGAFVVCGHRVAKMVNQSINQYDVVHNVELNHMAGIHAGFKVCDEVAYASSPSYYSNPNSGRGLVIINDNKTIPFFACNPYSMRRSEISDEADLGRGAQAVSARFGNSFYRAARDAKQIRNGFVVGVNGQVEICHNTFIHYVAASAPTTYFSARPDNFVNREYLAEQAIVDIDGYVREQDGYLRATKRHNPSALIIDGLTDGRQFGTLDTFLSDKTIDDDIDPNQHVVAYEAFRNQNYRHAKFILRGNARLYMHAAASERIGVTPDLFARSDTSTNSCYYDFTIGRGPYRVDSTGGHCPSYSVPALVNDQTNMLQDLGDSALGEGHHVLDAEGRLTVCSLDDEHTAYSNKNARHVGTNVSKNGVVNMPSVRINHAGVEVDSDSMPLATSGDFTAQRPLIPTYENECNELCPHIYSRYQSSCMFFNGGVNEPFFNDDDNRFEGIASVSFFDTRIVHNDVTKRFVIPDPFTAEPSITGGSRAVFDDVSRGAVSRFFGPQFVSSVPFPQLPVVRLFNTKIELHESLAVSGVRFAVTEQTSNPVSNEMVNKDNNSSLAFFNHSNLLDRQTGHGRMFMLGTAQNLSAEAIANGFQPYESHSLFDPPSIDQTRDFKGTFSTFFKQPFPLESAYINVYRRTQQFEPVETIKLSLTTQNRSTGQLKGQQSTAQQAKHLFYIANRSRAELGWTSEFGDKILDPWLNTVRGSLEKNQFDVAGTQGTIVTEPAELKIMDNHFWFGGTDINGPVTQDSFREYHGVTQGTPTPHPVMDSFDARVVFVNHGGKISIAPDKNVLFDTVLARRLSYNDDLSGKICIPMSQIEFTDGNSIQPYSLHMDEDSPFGLHLEAFSKPISLSPGQEMVIPWFSRTSNQSQTDTAPVKNSIDIESLTRLTQDTTAPVTMPSNLLFITSDDYIRQLRVMGATCADPFQLYITGDNNGFGCVREFTTQPMNRCYQAEPQFPQLTRLIYGSGDHAALFMDKGGRIGLGGRSWNRHSTEAWSNLGLDHITLYPSGNCVVDVNSDLLIVDSNPIIPTTNFGNVAQGLSHRIEFISEDNRVIRIPAGHELDLSAFGQAGGNFSQQIAFSGKVKLVFEPGSVLRFPDGQAVTNGTGPILYINDESEIVFLGNKDREQRHFRPNEPGLDQTRCKILGKGQIWLNKDAKLEIMDSAAIGIIADEKTRTTDVTISIQRQAQMFVGSEQRAGGSFQIGNREDLEDSTIDFRLRIEGPKALFHIDRQGFVGFGVGVVNKNSYINGDASTNKQPWMLQTLHNVNNITIDIIRGIFDHSNIFDGTGTQASLLAIGPIAEQGAYTFNIGNTETAMVFGGGNVMFMRNSTGMPVEVLSSAQELTGDNQDNGKYSILPSTIITRQRNAFSNQSTDTTLANLAAIEAFEFIDGRMFSGNQDDFYKYMTFPNFSTMSSAPNGTTTFVCLGATEFQTIAGWVNTTDANNISRLLNPVVYDGTRRTDAKLGLTQGVLGVSSTGPFNGPERFSIIRT